jgi:two-component system, cell cycle response regulator
LAVISTSAHESILSSLTLRRVALFGLAASVVLLTVNNLLDVRLGAPDLAWSRLYDGTIIASGLLCVTFSFSRRSERLSWLLIGGGIVLWGLGQLYWSIFISHLAVQPFPSIADGFWLTFYAPVYVGLFLLLRSRGHRFRASFFLDGVIGALAVAALGTAVVLSSVVAANSGDNAAVITNLAYPVADTVLLALVAVAFSLTGWRPDRSWILVALGFVLFAVTDSVYLQQIANGTYVTGTVVDLGWFWGPAVLAFAAAVPARRLREAEPSLWLLAVPAMFTVLALGLLIWDHFYPVLAVSVFLAGACVLAMVVRMGLTFQENLKILRERTDEAETDALTGLYNRRRVMVDLGRALDPPQEPMLFALFDLNGFKQYNDLFGHPAGDALLRRLGGNLAGAVGDRGSVYRIGGDEFCLLAGRGADGGKKLMGDAASALCEEGGGFAITAAHGFVELPFGAPSPGEALDLADQDMYANKNSCRVSATEQSSNVLMAALLEHDPRLGDHARGVTELAVELSLALGVEPSELETVRFAAKLHDIGKLAIPEAILTKPGPLDPDEWAFVQTHTVIGERIVAAAPSLAGAGRLIRSSHERCDGTGYPDGLPLADIPLGSLIIAVCDAFDAMISKRDYSPARSVPAALAELRANAGTQFDSRAVAAFCKLIAQRDEILSTPAPNSSSSEVGFPTL